MNYYRNYRKPYYYRRRRRGGYRDPFQPIKAIFILGLAFVIASYDPDRDKLFGIHGKFSEPPHLVMNEAVPESESVEEDMAEAVEIPEINDIEEAVDEVSDDRPLDAIGQEDDVKAKVELPGFSDEDSIVGMPDRGNQS